MHQKVFKSYLSMQLQAATKGGGGAGALEEFSEITVSDQTNVNMISKIGS